ncbi:MAG: NRDE family protein [Coraliomargarita sp.]
MCTLSWWINAEQRGVLFNRDEKRTRSKGHPPRLVETDESASNVLMPLDPDAGGSWIGVNEHGLIVALLNNYPHDQEQLEHQRSRGLLVLDLLQSCRTAAECMQQLAATTLANYRGFLLFAMGREGEPLAREWAGKQLENLPLLEQGGLSVLTTSSVRREDCENYRRELFAHLPRSAEALRIAHQHYLSSDPALGPLMVRDDAATDSITEITLNKAVAHMHYQGIHGKPPEIDQGTNHELKLT